MSEIDIKTPIELILYNKFIPMVNLKSIICSCLSGTVVNKITVYIDLYAFWISAFRHSRYDNNTCITECIINLAAHIKAVIRSLGIEPTVVLIQTPCVSNLNTQFIPEYNKKYTDRLINNKLVFELLKFNLNILETLVPYLPNLYLKKGTVESSVIIDNLIKTDFNDSTNFIYSLCPMMTRTIINNPNTYGIVIKKNRGIDNSYVYGYNNALQVYFLENEMKIPEVPKDKEHYISLMMTLFGVKRRNIKSILSSTHVYEIFDAIDPSIYNDTRMMFNIIQSMMKKKSFFKNNNAFEIFDARYKCLDINYQRMLYNTLPESQEKSYLNNLTDPNTLRAINNEYFKQNPLNLNNI